MIRTVTILNIETGDDLVLTLANPEISQGLAIVSMSGLGPEKATLNSTEWATIDGGSVNSTHIPMRQILMELKFIPTAYNETVADIRRKTYIYFPLKKKVRLTFDMYDLKKGHRQYYIEGWVEENTPTIWSDMEGCNISIKCEDPAFKNCEETVVSFSQIRGIFHMAVDDENTPIAFPDDDMVSPSYQVRLISEPHTVIFAAYTEEEATTYWDAMEDKASYEVYHNLNSEWPIAEILNYDELDVMNKSTLDVGVVFRLSALGGNVVNPIIYNRTTGERLQIRKTLLPGDRVIIDTREAHKNIINGDGSNTSMMQYLDIGSKFVHLQPGLNQVGFDADTGSKYISLEFSYREKYQGV